ncbi:GntR family transcriptional regulator [Sphingomonas sp. OTU376]|uniref:GntR family transcriptional regulator n=1 Tax=Sphingomonas sp. OTU376 TaxID=3043863 RepID=UPI00313D726D
MSPAHVLEPTYDALRHRLLNGDWPPGTRLEAGRIAAELGVSITPVRDSLNRLTGERLVHSNPGEGFQVPILYEADLCILLDWHAMLAGIAFRDPHAFTTPAALVEGHDGLAERTAIVFAAIAASPDNGELLRAIGNVAARLGRSRRAEEKVIPDAGDEVGRIAALLRDGERDALAEAVDAYHRRRRKLAGRIAAAARD